MFKIHNTWKFAHFCVCSGRAQHQIRIWCQLQRTGYHRKCADWLWTRVSRHPKPSSLPLLGRLWTQKWTGPFSQAEGPVVSWWHLNPTETQQALARTCNVSDGFPSLIRVPSCSLQHTPTSLWPQRCWIPGGSLTTGTRIIWMCKSPPLQNTSWHQWANHKGWILYPPTLPL